MSWPSQANLKGEDWKQASWPRYPPRHVLGGLAPRGQLRLCPQRPRPKRKGAGVSAQVLGQGLPDLRLR